MPRRTTVLLPALLAALLLSATGVLAAPPAHTAQARAAATPYPNTASFGVPFDTSEDWHRQCMRVAALPPLPAPAAPSPPSCNATDLYYQKLDQPRTTPAEWQEVHACAQASGDDAVLMMLYTNGFGHPRNLDRALRHACSLDSAKAEMEARVTYLALSPDNADGDLFDMCDHATSSYMRSVCAGLRDTRAERAYQRRLDRFAATLPARARAPFARLRKAADAFARQSSTEVDLSGSSGVGFALHHAARRREEFLQAVLDTAAGKVPRATPAQVARLDQQLEVQYRALAAPTQPEAAEEHIGKTTVVRADIRLTEQAWRAYRDAWAPYLAASGARVAPGAVQALLTRQRLAQLSRF